MKALDIEAAAAAKREIENPLQLRIAKGFQPIVINFFEQVYYTISAAIMQALFILP